jgi:putative sulfotransferase
VAFPELLYPVDAPNARFSSQTGVPGILLTALPHLTSGHDALFDQLGADVPTWPQSTITAHYRRLFDGLATRFGKQQWVERSGALLYVERLLSIFPDARFVHIVRDGRDTALSMHNHDAWRLGLTWQRIAESLGANPFESSDRTHIDRVPAELRRLLPEHFDREAFRAHQAPLQDCAGFWNYQLEAGLRLLTGLPGDRVLTLRYEDFFVEPQAQLDTLAAFIGPAFVDEDWSARCAATVRTPRSSWRDLPGDTAQELTVACRPGFERLRAVGVNYEL